MRLRRDDQSKGQRLERLQRRADPDLGRECLSFTFASPAALALAGPPSSLSPPPPPPPPLPPLAAAPAETTTIPPTADSSSRTEDPSTLRLRELERQVAQARAPLFSSSSSSSSPSATATAAAKRDLNRAAGSLLLRPPSSSSSTCCSPWWTLREKELDTLGHARVGALEAALAARDSEREARAVARVSAALGRAAAANEARMLKRPVIGGSGGKPDNAPLVLLPQQRRPNPLPSPPSRPLAPATERPGAALTAAQAPHRPTRAQRREAERIAALELVWEAHRHVLGAAD